jgi:hypothetical protein
MSGDNGGDDDSYEPEYEPECIEIGDNINLEVLSVIRTFSFPIFGE